MSDHMTPYEAEVVRLRREVSEFRDQMIESAEQYEALDHLLAAEYDRQIAEVLTRILEGEA